MNPNNNSPFLDSEPIYGVKQDAGSVASQIFADEASSPFLNVFDAQGGGNSASPRQEAFVAIVDELFDEEFEEALEDLAHEAEAWYENRTRGMSGAGRGDAIPTQQFMAEHYSHLLNEVELFFEHSVQTGRQFDEGKLDDFAFEAAINQYKALQQFETPEFEQLLGGFKKIVGKVKNIAKKGINLAKKIGLGPILNKLKGYAMKFMKNFLQKAMNKVPASLRPYAEKLHAKYIGKPKTATGDATGSTEVDKAPIQEEFNMAVAEMLLTPTLHEMDVEFEAFARETDASLYDNAPRAISVARERLVQRLDNLQEGESPEPAIEEFVGILMTGLKWAIKLIGQKRVKDFLTRQLAKITSKLVDKNNARQLSKLIVDQGFSMLNLEMAGASAPHLAHEAIASTLEDTLLKVAGLPDHVLQDEVLLEGFLMEAFEQAAAVNLPEVLSESAYQQNPGLRESNKRKLFWLNQVQKRGKNRFYKKLSQDMEAELTPYVMQEIKTHDGISLASFLRDSMGVNTRENVPARIRMFELLPGGALHHIARNESMTRAGFSDRFLTKQFHPLTSVAAGLLMGEPKLGCRNKKSKCLSDRKSGLPGHRYYYLEIPQAAPQIYTRQDGSPALRRPSQTRLKFNFIKRHFDVVLFFSEADAQTIAVLLRKSQLGRAQHAAISLVKSGMNNAFKYPGNGQLTIVHPMVMPGPDSGHTLRRVPPVVQQALHERLEDWIGTQLADYLKNHFQEFIDAAIHEADGLTMRFKLAAPESIDLLYDYIGGKQVDLSTRLFAQAPPETSISLQTDYSYE